MIKTHSRVLIPIVLTLLIASGCLPPEQTAQPIATLPAVPTLKPSPVIAILRPTPFGTPGPTPTSPPNQPAYLGTPLDYSPMIAIIETLIADVPYDVGAAFVDINTGQAIAMGRQGRFHAMSTFKGPLAAYYLWLLERGMITEEPGDENQIDRMLSWSSNTSTTCVLGRVGGIADFNDWLSAQGLDRQGNFLYSWNGWVCATSDGGYAPADDKRYRRGDPTLGLPPDGSLLFCPSEDLPCDAAFTPLDLTVFYARMYRGEVLDEASTERWLMWMEKPLSVTSIFDTLPEGAQDKVTAYAKNGFHPKERNYPVNFYHDAGILVTPYGAFALAVFMDKNDEWRGTDIHGQIGRLAYQYFTEFHAGQ